MSNKDLKRSREQSSDKKKTWPSIVILQCNTEADKQEPSYLVLEHKGNVHLEVKLVS